jgi:release factor glutamine methyltransferase
LLSDWFENISPAGYDLVISNPPYIESLDPHLSQGDLRFEPLQALASGEDGLEAIRSITAGCRQYLKPGGHLMLEHGYNQKGDVQKLFQAAGLQNIKTLKDFQENDRITIGRAK